VGGVQKTEHKRLNFSSDTLDDVSIDSDAGTTTTRSTGVDSQVAGLKGLKGAKRRKLPRVRPSTTRRRNSKSFREQQRAEELATADDDGAVTTVTKPFSNLLDRFRNLVKRN